MFRNFKNLHRIASHARYLEIRSMSTWRAIKQKLKGARAKPTITPQSFRHETVGGVFLDNPIVRTYFHFSCKHQRYHRHSTIYAQYPYTCACTLIIIGICLHYHRSGSNSRPAPEQNRPSPPTSFPYRKMDFDFLPRELDDILKQAIASSNEETCYIIDEHEVKLELDENNSFIGDIGRLIIEFRDITRERPQREPFECESCEFLVKIQPPAHEYESSRYVTDRGVFSYRPELYNEVLPFMMKYHRKENSEDLAPKCYLANRRVLVTENLLAQGFYACPKGSWLGLEELRAGVRALARFHSAGMLADRRNYSTLRDKFPRLFERHEKKARFIEAQIGKGAGFIEKVLELSPLANMRGFSEALIKLFDRAYNWDDEDKEAKEVLSHGAAWPSCLLFRRKNQEDSKDGSQESSEEETDELEAVLTDYDAVHYAPRTLDVAQFIYTGVHPRGRKRLEDSLLSCYHEEVFRCLGKPGLGFASYEALKREYEEMRIVAMYLSTRYLPICWLDRKTLSLYWANDFDDFYDRFFLTDDYEAILEVCASDEEYAKRVFRLVKQLLRALLRRDHEFREKNGELVRKFRLVNWKKIMKKSAEVEAWMSASTASLDEPISSSTLLASTTSVDTSASIDTLGRRPRRPGVDLLPPGHLVRTRLAQAQRRRRRARRRLLLRSRQLRLHLRHGLLARHGPRDPRPALRPALSIRGRGDAARRALLRPLLRRLQLVLRRLGAGLRAPGPTAAGLRHDSGGDPRAQSTLVNETRENYRVTKENSAA
ncbi:unnamed protein product [Trichogramma brassicae]|uniref:CHK kinase-like domain-containing protein n=1 Tax=Trichogramma brassicae TaxID=86971 RepID=A0A6H5IBP1_9HYME|nr:unnamed protein product [Trichogramma brassicae]